MLPTLPSDILHLIFEYNIPTSSGNPHNAEPLPPVWTPCEPNWRSSAKQLTSVVLVARSWWEAGMPLLYRHVQLASYGDLSAFVASLTSSKTSLHGGHGHWARRITYQFQCPHQNGDTTYPNPHLLNDLAQMLDACPNVQALYHGLIYDCGVVRQLYDPDYGIDIEEDVKIQAYNFASVMRGLQPSIVTSLTLVNKEKFTVWEVFGAINGLRSLESLAVNLVAIKDADAKFRDKSLCVSFPELRHFTCRFYLGEGREQSMAFLADQLEIPSLKNLQMSVNQYGTGWPIFDELTGAHLRRFLEQHGKVVEDLRLVLDFYDEQLYGGPDSRMRLEYLLRSFSQLRHLAFNPCEFVLDRQAGPGSSQASTAAPIHAPLLSTVTYVVPDRKSYERHMDPLGAPRLADTESLYRHLLAYADASLFPALEKICITDKRIILHCNEDMEDDYKRVEIGQAVEALLRRGVRVEVGVGVPIEMNIFDEPIYETSDDDFSDEEYDDERYWNDRYDDYIMYF